MIKNRNFILPILVVLTMEVLIATVFNHTFLRPVFGDFLVVILIYFFIRIFSRIESPKLALGVFIFACLVEIGQLIGIMNILGLQKNNATDLTLGSTFDWIDILAYATGCVASMMIDHFLTHKTPFHEICNSYFQK